MTVYGSCHGCSPWSAHTGYRYATLLCSVLSHCVWLRAEAHISWSVEQWIYRTGHSVCVHSHYFFPSFCCLLFDIHPTNDDSIFDDWSYNMTNMKVEDLPNELLGDVFGYLNAIDLFQAFYDLNERFNQLLIQLPSHHLDFHDASRVQFNDFCRHHLPRIAPQIHSVYLIGGNSTPMLPENFLAHGFTVDQFVHLRSVTLAFIPSSRSLDQMISQCMHLVHLERLCVIPSLRLYKYEVFNQIWKLPTLKSCTIGLKCFDESEFLKLSTVSRSIKRLTLNGAALQLDALVNIFRHTPELKHLQVGLVGGHNRPTVHNLLLCLTSMHLSYDSNSTEALIALFQQMPNLCRIKLDINRIYINGRAFEEIIDTYLPQLERFQFRSEFQALYLFGQEATANQILATFQSSFWTERKQWFVRIFWSDHKERNEMRLSTISYPFDGYVVDKYLRSKSTLPDHHPSLSSALRVTKLHYFDDPSTPSCPFISSFRDVRHLTMIIPCSDALLASIPMLDQLSSIKIDRFRGEDAYVHLQIVLDRATHLSQLAFPKKNRKLNMELFELKSHSIRKLIFPGNLPWDQEQCIKLATSPLGQQCRSLMIEVETLECVAELIDRMAQLRFLNLRQLHRGETEFLHLLRNKFPQISWTACEDRDALGVRGWIRWLMNEERFSYSFLFLSCQTFEVIKVELFYSEHGRNNATRSTVNKWLSCRKVDRPTCADPQASNI